MMRSLVIALLSLSAVSALELTHTDAYSFEQYLRDYDKQYDSHAEYQMRKVLFERRVADIKRHNSEGKSTFKKGVNALTDLTDSELESMMGRRHTAHSLTRPKRYPDVSVSRRRLQNINHLPKEVNWAKDGALTPPKNQGACGSCWTFSGSEAIEAAIYISTGKLLNISEQAFVSCTPNEHHCGGKGGCNGATQDILFEYAMEHGVYLEEDYPYVSGKGEEPVCKINGGETDQKKYQAVAGIKGYVDVPDNDLESHLVAIQSQPISVSVDASEWHLYSSGVVDFKDCGADINHAVLLAGYGTDEKTGLDYWLVRNSWGTKWGENGYIRLSRSSACAVDTTPADGTACEDNMPKNLTVCGTCGILFASSYPVGAYLK